MTLWPYGCQVNQNSPVDWALGHSLVDFLKANLLGKLLIAEIDICLWTLLITRVSRHSEPSLPTGSLSSVFELMGCCGEHTQLEVLPGVLRRDGL